MMFSITISIQYCIEILATRVKQENKIKRYKMWKGESQTVITHRINDCLHRKPIKDLQINTEIISTMAGNKINIQKSVHFYTPVINNKKDI